MATTVNHMVWISFDLGVGGDYEGMYRWLDTHKAKECGDSCAVLQFPIKTSLLAELKKDLKGTVKLNEKKHRIYIIYQDGPKTKGVYLIGRRRQSPWTGYGVLEEEGVDEA